MKTLKDIAVGQSAVVKKMYGEGATRRRMMDMGIIKGAIINVVKVAPLGDPIEVSVKNYQLSFRQADAELIEIEE